ncbi:MAG: phage tail protein [Bacteroidetes bacterium]|nr:phage tail protein [Bacteroidota bacterium]MBU1720218.1 phage tail protein [Bacteroidota bacterium]
MSKDRSEYLAGFHFQVDFLFDSQSNYAGPQDARFSEISGIGTSLDLKEDYHALGDVTPEAFLEARKFTNLVLKRGITSSSKLIQWFEESLFFLQINPQPVLVTLLNEDHKPSLSWLFYDAFPVKWTLDKFDASKSEYAIETIELRYKYYIWLKTEGMTAAQLDSSAGSLQSKSISKL